MLLDEVADPDANAPGAELFEPDSVPRVGPVGRDLEDELVDSRLQVLGHAVPLSGGAGGWPISEVERCLEHRFGHRLKRCSAYDFPPAACSSSMAAVASHVVISDAFGMRPAALT